jgi:sugar O-acyltransferase (sialic acid O-acetyltransferase NeuD family)
VRRRVAILGAGGHARVVLDTLRLRDDEFEVWGCLDDNPARAELDGVPVRGRIADLADLSGQFDSVALAVGHNATRVAVARRAVEVGCVVAPIRHPSAIVAETAVIGEGVMLAAGSIVQAGTCIEDLAIVNTAATVDHDGRIGMAAHIAPGVHLAGGVSVGARTLVGIGSAVAPTVSIGSDVVIGAGSVVVKDIPDGMVAYGSPARVTRKNSTDNG